MIRKVVVPVPVVSGVGSVSIFSTNSSSGFRYAYMNGKCIQVGLIPPPGSPSGTFYVYDETKWVPISGNFSDGAWNWSGAAGLVGDITVNIVSATVDGVYAIVFIFDNDSL